jgi:hypothetical protein
MSLNDVIAALRTTGPNSDGTYRVTRSAMGTRVAGRYIGGATTTIDIVASIKPITGRDLQDVPEGRRADETIKIFTAVPIFTVGPGGQPDVIGYQPPGHAAVEPWTVITVRVCEGFGETHYEAIACRAPSPDGVVP